MYTDEATLGNQDILMSLLHPDAIPKRLENRNTLDPLLWLWL